MPTAAMDRGKALMKYHSATSTIMAFLIEERICRLALEQCPSFIKAFESSPNDAGLVVDPEFKIERGEGPADTFFTFLREHPDVVFLALVDMKMMTFGCDSKGGANHVFRTSRAQLETTHVLILASPFDPDFVAVVPMHYISPTRPKNHKPLADPTDEDGETTSLPTIWPMWSLQELPAFGPEYTTFIRPISQLGRAFESMLAHVQNPEIPWVNDYTGAVFTHPPPLTLSNSSGISPRDSQTGTYNSMWQVRDLLEAFRDHSKRFRVELIGVAPLIGDVKLVDKDTQKVVAFIELKRTLCRVVAGLSGSGEIFQHNQASTDQKRLIFDWKAQWDYIFTTTVDKPDTAYFFPRGSIPASWWNVPYSKPFQLQMMDGFQQYRVNTGSFATAVRDIEAILTETEMLNGSMEASDPPPLGYNSIDEPGDTTPNRPQNWGVSNPLKGFGLPEETDPRAYAYEFWVSEVVNEMCRAFGRGVVLDFGIWNEICHFAIADIQWGPRDSEYWDKYGKPPRRVWNFPKTTEVVPLSFTRHRWTGHWAPHNTSQSENQSKGIGQRPPSLVICDLYSPSCLRLRHGRFVIPSGFLKKFGRRDRNHLQQGRGAIDEYLVEHDDLIATLLAPFRGTVHVPAGTGEIEAVDYCQTLETIHQAGVEGVEAYRHAMCKKYGYE